jgi:protein gp37
MMDKYGRKQRPLHLDERELRSDLGKGNYIFVCSGCDLFHHHILDEVIIEIIDRAKLYKNKYLWHTKNPSRAASISSRHYFPEDSVLCATIESDFLRHEISNAPQPSRRIDGLKKWPGEKMITIDPVINFNVLTFSEMILSCNPIQVNIGADSGNNHLPEPSPEKIEALIEALKPYTEVHLKKNLRRILPKSKYYQIA